MMSHPETVPETTAGFPIDGHLVLIRPGVDRLFLLNPTARLIWDLLRERRSARRIVEHLQETYGITATQARRDLADILAHWERESLLGTAPPATGKPGLNPYPFRGHGPLTANTDFDCNLHGDYRLFDLVFRLHRHRQALP